MDGLGSKVKFCLFGKRSSIGRISWKVLKQTEVSGKVTVPEEDKNTNQNRI